MKRRAFGAAAVSALIAAFTASSALADNPHGTPPGQAAQSSQPAGAPTAGNSGNVPPGQAKQSSQQQQQQQQQQSAPAAQAPAPTASAGVKPSSTTQHHTFATADSGKTKLYGNGKTAGGIAMSRGASGSTVLYGPGNSQPHKVAVCKNGKTHYVDVHAVKSYGSAGACAPSASAATSNAASSSNSSSSNVTSSSSVSASSNVSSSSHVSSSTASTRSSVLGATHSHVATTHHTAHVAAKAKPRVGVLGARYTSSPKHPATGVLATTAHSGQLPFTGLPLWVPLLSALFVLGLGSAGLRYARSKA